MLRSAMQKYLYEKDFAEVWKRQSLILLPKAEKTPRVPSANRPICLLDSAGKVLRKIIFNRMLKYTEGLKTLEEPVHLLERKIGRRRYLFGYKDRRDGSPA